MKKIILFFAIAIIICGCASAPQKQTSVDLIGDSIEGVVVTVEQSIQYGDGFYQSSHPDKTTKGFLINIKNESSDIIKILWDNSSITDSTGTHRIFISGQKYINANESLPPLIIPFNGKVQKEVYSADSVEWSSLGKTWVIKPMEGELFTLTLCIDKNGKESFITFTIAVSDIN